MYRSASSPNIRSLVIFGPVGQAYSPVFFTYTVPHLYSIYTNRATPSSFFPKGLVTNYRDGGGGGATKREGEGQVLPLQKGRGGGRTNLSHAEGGGSTTSFGVVFRW